MSFPIRLEYTRYEPGSVFDRTHAGGLQGNAFATVGWSIERVLEELRQSYAEISEADRATLLSMEIFAGAGIEVSQRAQFLATVSALEPLSQERSLGPEVGAFVDSCLARLDQEPSVAPAARASILGRLQQLRSESVRQGILRVIRESLPEYADAPEIVDEAYAVRSQIVHDGRPNDLDLDLGLLGQKVSEVLRNLYSVRLKRPLYGARWHAADQAADPAAGTS